MLRFSANLSILFQEVPLRERFAAAAQAGFQAVELWFPYEIPAEEMVALLKQHALVCVGMNTAPGEQPGDWGLALDPLRQREFMAGVEQAMAYAQAIDCLRVNVMAGNPPPGLPAAEAWALYTGNIAKACAVAKLFGRRVMVEPLNALDRPPYYLQRQEQALALVETLKLDNLGIMLDLFHIQRGEGNLVERIRKGMPYAEHVQVADVPGRHEPGTGEINYPFVFAELERLGYSGWVGCEYVPAGATADGLGWMHALQQAATKAAA